MRRWRRLPVETARSYGKLPGLRNSLLGEAVRFVTARLLEHGAELRPAYTVAGGSLPDEQPLGLPGYPGGTDILGNHVNAQYQLDAFGETLLLIATADRAGRLDADGTV